MKSGSSATVEPARVTFNGTVCCWSEAIPTVRVHISLRLPTIRGHRKSFQCHRPGSAC